MLELMRLTVVIIDDIEPELAKLAIRDTLKVIRPFELIVVSTKIDVSKLEPTWPMPITHINLPIKSKRDYQRALWQEVPTYVRTSHILTIQWDGWAVNPEAWSDEFLKYDYIGAVWPWYQHRRVGNGGFSLRSKRLIQELSRWPLPDGLEDDTLCRVMRPMLEHKGMVWASDELAMRFSTEWSGHSGKSFGFHGIWNWPTVLDDEALLERRKAAGPYAKATTEWRNHIGGDLA